MVKLLLWGLGCLLMQAATSAQAPKFRFVPSASFPTIQSAISAAQNGDFVIVAAGIYNENIDFEGKRIGVVGSGQDSCTIDGSSLLAPTVTIVGPNLGAGTLLDGFTITGGRGTIGIGGFGVRVGGGVLIEAFVSGPGPTPALDFIVVKNCRITFNDAVIGAGMAVLGNSDLKLINLDFEQNATVISSGPLGTNGQGGGVIFIARNLEVLNCRFVGNVGSSGGAMFGQAQDLEIRDCLFDGNSAISLPIGGAGRAGAISVGVFGSRTAIYNSKFLNNTAEKFWGAAIISATTSPDENIIVEGCEFTKNVAGTSNSALTVYGSARIENCTISDNQSLPSDCGALVLAPLGGNITLRNTISWGNSGGELSIIAPSSFSFPIDIPVTVESCNIQGGFPGLMNVDLDPKFRDPVNGDYHLSLESPLIDGGVSTPSTLTSLDLDGQARELMAAPDLGAYEVNDGGLSPVADGTDGNNGGLLSVSGSVGNVARRVEIATGSSWSLHLDRSETSSSDGDFIISGAMGIPLLEDAFVLPLGLGTMSFPPCVLFPQFEGRLFTFTDNLTALPCDQVLASHPAPWTSSLLPSLPSGTVLSFQALMQNGQGGFEVTNLVIAVFL